MQNKIELMNQSQTKKKHTKISRDAHNFIISFSILQWNISSANNKNEKSDAYIIKDKAKAIKTNSNDDPLNQQKK